MKPLHKAGGAKPVRCARLPLPRTAPLGWERVKKTVFPDTGLDTLDTPAKPGRICAKNPVALWGHTETGIEGFAGHAAGLHAGFE